LCGVQDHAGENGNRGLPSRADLHAGCGVYLRDFFRCQIVFSRNDKVFHFTSDTPHLSVYGGIVTDTLMLSDKVGGKQLNLMSKGQLL
jgi:hypothetical protein